MLKFLLIALGLFSSQVMGQTNNCVTFSVGQGTGCEWMCNYCANMLGTNNYYFTDNVCTYESSGCVGNPVSGKSYTCCSAGEKYNIEIKIKEE
jgi:hypothetical protein